MSVLAIRLVLAAVFATAAAAKLAGRREAIEGFETFGLGRRLSKPLARALPVVELAIAAFLLPARTAAAGAVAAAGLLAVFTGAIAYQLARGRRPDCNCFGRLRAKPIGPSTLARNVMLLGLAASAAVVGLRDRGPSALAWLSDPLLATIGGLTALVLAQAVLLVLVLRRHGQILARLDDVDAEDEVPAGLPVGSEAPEFELPDLEGEPVTLAALRKRRLPVLLLFSDPACGPCSALLPEVGRWQQEWARELTLAVISNASPEQNRASAAEHDLTLVLSQEKHELSLAYGALGTPMAVLVDGDGRIAGPLAAGEAAIAELVAQAVSTEEVLVRV
jgi:methylamine dehydrogenase accessory protein MauD